MKLESRIPTWEPQTDEECLIDSILNAKTGSSIDWSDYREQALRYGVGQKLASLFEERFKMLNPRIGWNRHMLAEATKHLKQ